MNGKEINVLLVTSKKQDCGIREYGKMLIEAMELVAPEIRITERPDPHYENPYRIPDSSPDIIHLNHHASYDSWTESAVRSFQSYGIKMVITQHDTFETFDIMRERGMPDFRGADALVVHEPVAGLEGANVHYIRQGVSLFRYPVTKVARDYPVVGTVGFPFPWKNYDLLMRASARAGWGVVLIAPGATVAQCEEWQGLNPRAEITPYFTPKYAALEILHACDATAFLYNTGNSGTSGALRMGIAARRPIIASPCRQTRDLEGDSRIYWAPPSEAAIWAVLDFFKQLSPERRRVWAESCASLAEEDSWLNAAREYARIYREVAGGREDD